MTWENCISPERKYSSTFKSTRNHYQRDFDRIIFSPAFRRLQNKTQVFPFPENSSIHNRLTHSLEVSCVGRSLGQLVGQEIANQKSISVDVKGFYLHNLSEVIAAACLAHDLGNPPFGHSGEDAISSYFKDNADSFVNGSTLRDCFSDKEWSDLINYEGNANALHILTKKYHGKLDGGMNLTYTTLASILKYPCSSYESNKSNLHTKKYGYFQSDFDSFKSICIATSMVESTPTSYLRHPYVYLVEAADDICYNIMDIEDAHKLQIISYDKLSDLFIQLLSDIHINKTSLNKIVKTLKTIKENNEKVSYLRAKIINFLVEKTKTTFLENKNIILEGKLNSSLFDLIVKPSSAYKEIKTISINNIYNHPSVVEQEIMGYNAISFLLSIFCPALLNNTKSKRDTKILSLIPYQFHSEDSNNYVKIISFLDYLSGMTDTYIIERYKVLRGFK